MSGWQDSRPVLEILLRDCKNDVTTPHKQRNPRETRTSLLFELLLKLNHRIANYMYGGMIDAVC